MRSRTSAAGCGPLSPAGRCPTRAGTDTGAPRARVRSPAARCLSRRPAWAASRSCWFQTGCGTFRSAVGGFVVGRTSGGHHALEYRDSRPSRRRPTAQRWWPRRSRRTRPSTPESAACTLLPPSGGSRRPPVRRTAVPAFPPDGAIPAGRIPTAWRHDAGILFRSLASPGSASCAVSR